MTGRKVIGLYLLAGAVLTAGWLLAPGKVSALVWIAGLLLAIVAVTRTGAGSGGGGRNS